MGIRCARTPGKLFSVLMEEITDSSKSLENAPWRPMSFSSVLALPKHMEESRMHQMLLLSNATCRPPHAHVCAVCVWPIFTSHNFWG